LNFSEIYKDEIVFGDIIFITLGLEIPVDGLALRANDLSVLKPLPKGSAT
jgi:magnesium-transporting ATPase (P-type)